MPICEICGKELANPDSPGHVNSKYHQDALNKLEEAKKTPKEAPKKEEQKPEPKKEEPKPGPKIEEPKTAPKREEKKIEPIKETPKLAPKKEEKAPEPKKEVSKPAPKKDVPKKAPKRKLSLSLKTKKKRRSFQAEKLKIYGLLHLTGLTDIRSAALSILFIVMSVASGFTVIFETVSYVQTDYYGILLTIEIIALCVFGTELALRLWVSDVEPKYKNQSYKQLRYLLNFQPMVDLLSVISIILGLIIPINSDARAYVRILHLVLFLKLVRYSQSFEIIWSVIKRKKEELLITFILSLLLMFFGSLLIFLAEHEAQPDVFTNMFSSMWFSAINLFTIGYGEIVPITTMGKMVSAVVSVMGVTLFLLPASVIGSGFVDEIQARNPQYEVCPECHKAVERSQLLRDIYAQTRGRKAKVVEQALEVEEKTKKHQKSSYARLRQQNINQNIEFRYPRNIIQVLVFFFFATFITFNVLAIMAETNPDLYQENQAVLFTVFIISTVVFTAEYVIRVWSIVASEEEKFQDPIRGRLNYMGSFMGVVDLIFLISLYLTIFLFFSFPTGIPFLLVLRMLVVLKIGHFLAVFDVIGAIIRYSKKEFFTTLFVCIMFLIMASTIIYHFEKDAQPDKYSSIPATLWFGVTTFTTTGFGDIYPITTLGRFTTIAFAFLGVSLFTLPAGILGASFFNSMKEFRMYMICPQCGFIISKPKLSKKRISF